MEENVKFLLDELNLKNEIFYRVNSNEYAEEIRELCKDRNFWYEHISPRETADKLFERTKGDYLQIWHEHCQSCYCEINAQTKEPFYRSESGDWLCEQCFRKLQPYLSKENKNL